ncbi:MAG: hypothetical protein U5M51_06980 [Emticicia sp.]|nr:hypothetical protein [Emticicia sp.]
MELLQHLIIFIFQLLPSYIRNIYLEEELVYVFTARKQVQICMDDDICLAAPVFLSLG